MLSPLHTDADALPAIRRLRAMFEASESPSDLEGVVDRFAELCFTPGWMDLGAPVEVSELEQAVRDALWGFPSRPGAFASSNVAVQGADFVHGFVTCRDAQLVYFWFTDLARGVAVRFDGPSQVTLRLERQVVVRAVA